VVVCLKLSGTRHRCIGDKLLWSTLLVEVPNSLEKFVDKTGVFAQSWVIENLNPSHNSHLRILLCAVTCIPRTITKRT